MDKINEESIITVGMWKCCVESIKSQRSDLTTPLKEYDVWWCKTCHSRIVWKNNAWQSID